MSVLRSGYLLLAQKLQEAADSLTSSDVRARLADCIADCYRGSGKWANYIDHTGDGTTGSVIYACDGDVFQAPYEISGGAGTAAKCVIDTDKAVDVVPRTIYEQEEDEGDHYAAMESQKLYLAGLPQNLYLERVIPKSERAAAGSGSFAGKGKSFPILKKEDVKAAVSSVGRAGPGNYSTDTILANIKRIATAKGWASELPASGTAAPADKAKAKEAGARNSKTDLTHIQTIHDSAASLGADCAAKMGEAAVQVGEVALVESAGWSAELDLRESTTVNPLLKIISPGRGSSGWYSAEVLQRDGPKIFDRGTLMYANHATKAEEAARPEGNYDHLLAVTTARAAWDENGKDGPALYAPVKIFSGRAAEVAEKAPYTGASIRASGKRDDKAIAPDGKPGVITELTHAESIDLVTKAGRDGKLLLESADSNLTEGGDMDSAELKKLQEANRKIAQRLAVTEARVAAEATLKTIRLPESSKVAIVERALTSVPITEAGDFDATAFKAVMEAEIKYAASFVPGGATVIGLGAPVAADPKVQEAARVEDTKARVLSMDRSARAMGVKTEEGKRIFREGRAAFDPNYCSLDEKGVA